MHSQVLEMEPSLAKSHEYSNVNDKGRGMLDDEFFIRTYFLMEQLTFNLTRRQNLSLIRIKNKAKAPKKRTEG